MEKMKKLKIGVTGGIGSGKSEFCKFLIKKGFPVINVDNLAKELLVSDANIKSDIIKQFGEASYNESGKINKKYISGKVFSASQNVQKINSIVHPKVKEKVQNIISDKLIDSDIVIVEAALIYEASMDEMFDYVVLITADEKIRMERMMKYSGYSIDEFTKRNENQISDEEKIKRADFIFINNGTPDELNKKANLFINIIHGLIV